MRALTEEQKRLDGQVSEAEQELIRLRDAVREAEEQRDAKQDRRDLLRAVLGNETAALNQAKAKQDANRTLLDKLRDDSDRILAESRQYEQDMESLRAEEAALTAAIGEVGLTGEIRAVTGLQQRLSEASRTGFKTCIIPRHGTGNVTAPDGMELLRVRNIREAIQLVLS